MPPKKRVLDDMTGDEEKDKFFKGVCFSFSGTFSKTHTDLSSVVKQYGGDYSKTVTAKVTHLVTTIEDYKKNGSAVQKATSSGIHIVSELFINKSIETLKKVEEKTYTVTISNDDEEEEESSSEEEEEVKKVEAPPKKPAAKRAAPKAKAKVESSSEESSSEEEAPPPKKTESKKPAAKRAAPKAKAKVESSSSSEEESSESESEEETKRSKKRVAKGEDKSNHVTIQIKGRAPVDTYFELKNKVHVYDDGKDIYDVTLNQTEISQNNNKFYILQLLEEDNGSGFYVYTRWGREGVKGLSKTFPFGKHQKDSALSDFYKKFKEKTNNHWVDRHNFVKHKGKYDLIELDYSSNKKDDDEDEEEEEEDKPKKVAHKEECNLDDRIQSLIKLIFDVKMMEKTLVEASYDIKKMPLGKLSKAQMKKGYAVLKRIEAVLSNRSKEDLTSLSSEFYTAIPHVFGMSTPPTIRDKNTLQQKMDMLESLADIEIATKLIKESEKTETNLLENYYAQLKTKIVPLEKNSEEYKNIVTFMKNTHPQNTPNIVNIFEIDREGERARFEKTLHLGNRKLLWHGSRLTNFVGIISQGLRIAPPEAPVSGYRFGKGIYLADIAQLSSVYCRTAGTSDFCMLLGETVLGKTFDAQKDTYMEKAQPGTHSTFALGKIEPDPSAEIVHKDGYSIPLGKIIDSPYKNQNVSCREHQYVVYSVDQVNLRYLLQLKGN